MNVPKSYHLNDVHAAAMLDCKPGMGVGRHELDALLNHFEMGPQFVSLTIKKLAVCAGVEDDAFSAAIIASQNRSNRA